MSQPTHWPKFAAAALELGVQCSLSFQPFVRKDIFGALNLDGDEAGVFDDESLLYGEILAQHASVAMASSRSAEQMHRAIASRDQGIIMERFQIDAVQAFALLTRGSLKTRTPSCLTSPSTSSIHATSTSPSDRIRCRLGAPQFPSHSSACSSFLLAGRSNV
jgi:hypothetical protein